MNEDAAGMKRSIIIAIIVAAILVPATVYAASPLFVSSTINEPLPVVKTGESSTAQDGAEIEDEMMEKDKDAMVEDDSMPGESMEKEEEMVKDEEMAEKEDAMMMKETSGTFAGAGDGIHNAQGSARVLNLEDGSAVLRLEDFRVTNGPDLYVYLSTDKGASDYVDLGRLKANAGNQNYELPSGIDLFKYDNVVIWCKAFSVYFGGAQLTAA
jgi:hypothetical protein